jgi:hypothetical protein
MAELCYAESPVLHAAAVLAGVCRYRPDAELADGERGAILMSYRSVREEYPESRSAPLVTAITTPVADQAQRDLTHTAWAQAGAALFGCRYSLVVTEFLGREVDTATRLAAFRAVLRAVIESTAPLATWWPASQQAVDPRVVALDPLAGAVNVRQVPDGNDPDVGVVDTLGLSQLGLPDLQCHFRYLNSELLADLFGRTAREMVAGGTPPLAAIRGITRHQRWPVRSAPPLVGPVRPVLTVDPGQPFVVGADTRRGTDTRHSAYD